MAINYPEINGHVYAWSSVRVKFGKNITRCLKSLNYTDALTPGGIRGNNSKKQGRTVGIHEPEASATFYRRELIELLNDLGDGYGAVSFDIEVSCADTGQPVTTDEIIGVRITKVDLGGEEGEDALECDVEFDVMDVKIDGKSIAPKPPQ